MKLPQHPLGDTGLRVSPLGIGTVKWGRTEGLKHAAFSLPEDRVCEALLDTALESGVTLLDTAPAYGIAEERLGRLLGARRDAFTLLSKTGEIFRDGAASWDFSAEHTNRGVEESLRRLRADVLDGVLVHSSREDLAVVRDTPVLETLHHLKSRGLLRAVGFSVMSVEGGLAALPLCDVVMVAWNPGFREHEPVIREAARLGKGVLLKKVFQSGNLEIADLPPGVTPAAHCVRSALALPGHPAVIVGTIHPGHLRENIAAAFLTEN